MTIQDELIVILNQLPAAIEKAFYEAMVLRHPGHGNQKTHGNRFGAGQAKESLRRLKDDKGAREKYKETHRKRGQGDVLSSLGKSADTGFMGGNYSFDDFIKSQRDIFGPESVKVTQGKRGTLFETGTEGYIKVGNRILSGSSGFNTKRIFEKIQTDKGLKEFVDKNRELAEFRKSYQK